MSINYNEKVWKLAPIWLPLLLALLKFSILSFQGSPNEVFFNQGPCILAFSGFSFIAWAFTRKATGESYVLFKCNVGKINGISKTNEMNTRNINEFFIILCLMIIQIVIYMLSVSISMAQGDIKKMFCFMLATIFTVFIPYRLVMGRL